MKKHSFSEKLTNFMNGKGFYIALAFCVVTIAASCWYLWREVTMAGRMIAQTSAAEPVTVDPSEAEDVMETEPVENAEDVMETEPMEDAADADAPLVPEAMESDPADILPPEEEEAPGDMEAETAVSDDAVDALDAMEPVEDLSAVETAEPVTIEESAPTIEAEVVSADADEWLWPLNGAVVSAFSADALAYNEALGDWRTHEGVDLAADLGTEVVAAHAGEVYSVTDDMLLGKTVTIDCGGGLKTVYANLAEEVAVAAGDSVKAGDVIGTVGQTAVGEDAGEGWLHFAALRDGEAVDPAELIEG